MQRAVGGRQKDRWEEKDAASGEGIEE